MRMATSPNSFIQAYLNRGFGSMTKNDFEVMIFAELIQTSLRGMSDYQISCDLRIPESKVKRLRYEASLKYNILSEDDYRLMFKEIAQNAIIKDEKIILSIEDISLRKFINFKLKKNGKFSDTSFNSEIVVIRSKDFAELLKELYYTQRELKQINDKIDKINESLSKKITFKDVISVFINASVAHLGERLIDIGADSILNFIQNTNF